jgi:glycosyltransferase involved in cell wall biosynthesis
MLNPGMVGLSVLDAFAAQLPLLTTQLGKHSPEIAYLQHGVNGLMLENDLGSYVQACVDLLRNPAQCEALSAGCAASAQEYTLAHMAERFCAGIVECLGAPAYRAGVSA